MPGPWQPPDPRPLHDTDVYLFDGADNRTPLDRLLQRDLPSRPFTEFWIALVPGCSEQNGHHRAFVPQKPGDPLVEPEFLARLHHAYRLLDNDIVQAMVISGGSVDAQAPDYNEALRGREQLLRDRAGDFTSSPAARGDSLASRIIADPFAIHSVSNVRNAARLAILLGLDRLLVVTTKGLFKQGWWLTGRPPIGSFTQAAEAQVGYDLGAFELLDPGPRGDNQFGTGAADDPDAPLEPIATEVILHWNLSRGHILADPHWD
jgi:hypothetical protein